MFIRPARPDEQPLLLRFVRAAALPTDGLDATWLTVVAENDDRLVGVAALEKHGTDGAIAFLLRSVVVDPQMHGKGIGRSLVTAALAAADVESGGTATVALLTETADGYFERFGFTAVERDDLPRSLSASPELAGACPVTARAYWRRAPPAKSDHSLNS